MSAADELSKMLAEGRANDPYLAVGYPTSAEANYDAMNPYMQQINQDNPYVEEPNDWAKMLMSLADQNNQWSAAQAQKQMNFQERMSNTAHVREIADLKAAGLNPVLSAKLGGASTPVGAQGTTDTSITGSIVQLMDKMLDVEQSNAQMNLTREIAASRGSGSGSGENLLAALIDLIPGISQGQAKAFANAADQSGITWKLVEGVSKVATVAKDYAKDPKYKSAETHGLSSRYHS